MSGFLTQKVDHYPVEILSAVEIGEVGGVFENLEPGPREKLMHSLATVQRERLVHSPPDDKRWYVTLTQFLYRCFQCVEEIPAKDRKQGLGGAPHFLVTSEHRESIFGQQFLLVNPEIEEVHAAHGISP